MQDFLAYINRAKLKTNDDGLVLAEYSKDTSEKKYIKHRKEEDESKKDKDKYARDHLVVYLEQALQCLAKYNSDQDNKDTINLYKKIIEEQRAILVNIVIDECAKKAEKEKIAKQFKKVKKSIQTLKKTVQLHIQISYETPEQLIKAINECKSFKEFDQLKSGKNLLGFAVPGFRERFRQANQGGEIDEKHFNAVLEKKEKYLRRKQTADRIAIALTFALSLIGIGFVSAVAIMALFPAIPFAGLIASVSVLTLLGGIPEALVFHKYIKRFTRTFVRGLFKKIDDNIINREVEQSGENNPDAYASELDAWMDTKKNRYSLAVGKHGGVLREDRDKILSANWKVKLERFVKKALVILSIPLSMAAGVGFVGLTFIEALELFTTLGVAGLGLTVAPWALALVVGPIYGMVMFSMINEAIKDNIFKKIKDHVVEMFSPKDNKTFAELLTSDKFKHIGLCALKAFGISIVFGISVLATVFTAGAWLKNSAEFFVAACSLPKKIADIAGVVVGAIVLKLNLGFSSENSLNTAHTLGKIKWSKVGKYLKKIVTTPKKLLKAFVNLFPLIVHIGGMGAVASIGAEAFVLKLILGPVEWVNKLIAGLTEIVEEFLVDFQEAVYEPFNHNEGHHDHQHLDLYSLCHALGKLIKSGFMSLVNGFSREADDVNKLLKGDDTKGMMRAMGGSGSLAERQLTQPSSQDLAISKEKTSTLVTLSSFRKRDDSHQEVDVTSVSQLSQGLKAS